MFDVQYAVFNELFPHVIAIILFSCIFFVAGVSLHFYRSLWCVLMASVVIYSLLMNYQLCRFFQTVTKCTLLTCDELHLLIFENV